MNNLRHILSKYEIHHDEIIYVLFCENDKFYVGHTINLLSRMKYGHFGKYSSRIKFLQVNQPLELVFIIRTGITYIDNINVHDIEDYVTVVVSKKYGAENVFGGFRHLKIPIQRIKFVDEYNFSTYAKSVELIDSLIDFELPEIFEINDALFGEKKIEEYPNE